MPVGPTQPQQFDRVPAEADGGVDDDLARLRVEGGEHFGEHDRPMLAGGGGTHDGVNHKSWTARLGARIATPAGEAGA